MKITFLLKLLFIPLLIFGQDTGSLTGTLKNELGRPVAGVQIRIEKNGLNGISNDDGQFIMEQIQPGIYELTFSHIGYEKIKLSNISIKAGQTTQIPAFTLTTKIFNTDASVVTATRTRHRTFDLPHAINQVSQKMILECNASTPAEALREETGLSIQKTNHGGGSAIIRGFSANRILILIDGFRLNNSLFRMGNHQFLTTVDFASLQSIEVVRGPASSIFGSDALGGIIQLVTQKPAFAEVTEKNSAWNFNLLGRTASADGQIIAHSDLSWKNEQTVLLGSFSYKKFGHLRRGAKSDYPQLENSTRGLEQYPSAFSGYDYLFKGIHKLNESSSLIYSLQSSVQEDVPRYDKYENSGYHLWHYNPQIRNMGYMIYEWRPGLKAVSQLKTGVSWQKQTEGRIIQKADSTDRISEKDAASTVGVLIQVRSFWNKHDIIYGLDFYTDFISSERFISADNMSIKIRDLASRFPDDARYHSLGLYLQDEKRVTGKIRLLSGLRYNLYQTSFQLAENNDDVKLNYRAFSGNLRLVYEMSRQLHLNLNLSQAFRAPNLSDLAKLGQSKGDIYEVPNPTLKPEQLTGIEAGLKYKSIRFNAASSIFYSYVYDLIERADAMYKGLSTIDRDGSTFFIKSRQNVGRAYITGIENRLDYQFITVLNFYFNLTWTYGQNIKSNHPVSSIPPLFGTAGIRGTKQKFNYRFFFRFAGTQYRLSDDDKDDPRIPKNGSPSWYTINIRLGYRFTEAYSLQAAVENILDLNYREHASGINAPGRNYIFSLSYNY